MNAAQRRLWQRIAQFGAAISLICWLLGCAMSEQIPGQLAGSTPKPDGVMDPVLHANLHATAPTAVPSQAGAAGQTTRPLLFPGADTEPPPQQGTGIEASAVPNGALMTGTEGVDINFENADIGTVARTLLGDTLGVSFVVDPRVQGSITLSSNGPIARKDVLPVFESVLRMSNAAVIREGNLVKILPVPEATGGGPVTLGGGEPGFGVSIVPLRYTSAPTIAKAVENFVTRPGAVRVDQARNLLLIQGTTSERRDALVVIATFDVEWLHNQSVGIYPLKSTSPETMIRELEKVFDASDGGQGQGVIKFQPVARMNAVMVVSRNEKMLDRATQWVTRLDHADTSATTVRIYQLSFGNATKIAKILNDIFVGKSGAGAENGPANQLAPGTNGTTSRLDALSAGGGAGGTGAGGGSSSTSAPSPGQSGGSDSNSRASIQTAFGSFADRWNQDESSAGGSSGGMPRGVFQNVRITANTSDNSIVVYSNQEDYRVIEHALQQLDRPQLQVAIDAMVAEVSLNDNLQYGVQFFLTSSAVGAGSNQGSAGLINAATSTAQTALLSRVLPGFNLLLGSEANPRLILSALDTVTTTKVLSAPSLVVTDNQPAILEVGQDVPITTGSATVLTTSNTVVNTIDMRSTGIILKVLPHVHPNGSIELELEQEVSAVAPTSTPGTLTPTITERRVHSTVRMTSGQTVLLGGLISENNETTKAGIPVVDQIKYLGDLLSNKTDIRNRTEIIIFVKAQLIRNGFDAQKVSEEFRERLQSMMTPRAVVTGTDVGPPAVVKK